MQPKYVRNPEELAEAVTIGETIENIVLDFKRTIDNWNAPKGTPDRVRAAAQKETCRDIAQFANTNGGCVLIGIEERDDPDTHLKVAAAIHSVTDPDAMRQWIEQAISNYLVPATLTRDIVPVLYQGATVLVVNIPPSIQLITLWDPEQHTIECPHRTSHGKTWMNPDELERHIMNGSRAAKLTFERALDQATTREVRVAGGYWQRVGNPPANLARWHLDSPVTIGDVADEWFELRFRVGPQTYPLIIPFGVVEAAWVGADGRMQVLLSVRTVHTVLNNELTIEPYIEA